MTPAGLKWEFSALAIRSPSLPRAFHILQQTNKLVYWSASCLGNFFSFCSLIVTWNSCRFQHDPGYRPSAEVTWHRVKLCAIKEATGFQFSACTWWTQQRSESIAHTSGHRWRRFFRVVLSNQETVWAHSGNLDVSSSLKSVTLPGNSGDNEGMVLHADLFNSRRIHRNTRT